MTTCCKTRKRHNETNQTERNRSSLEYVHANAPTLQETHATVRNVRNAMPLQNDCKRTHATTRRILIEPRLLFLYRKNQYTPQLSEHELVTKTINDNEQHRSGGGKNHTTLHKHKTIKKWDTCISRKPKNNAKHKITRGIIWKQNKLNTWRSVRKIQVPPRGMSSNRAVFLAVGQPSSPPQAMRMRTCLRTYCGL